MQPDVHTNMILLRRLQGVKSLCNETVSSRERPSEEVWSTLMAIYLGTVILLSLLLNGTLCLVFYKKQHLLSISNCFVLNLSCCQLGKLPSCQPRVTVASSFVYKVTLYQGHIIDRSFVYNRHIALQKNEGLCMHLMVTNTQFECR